MNINFGAGTNSGTGQANIYCDILFNYKKNIGETYCLITAGNNCNIWCNMVLPNGINNFNFYSYGTRYWNGAICFPNTIRFINAYNLYGYYNLHVRFANMSDEDFANITSGLNITNLYANTLVIPNYCNRIYNIKANNIRIQDGSILPYINYYLGNNINFEEINFLSFRAKYNVSLYNMGWLKYNLNLGSNCISLTNFRFNDTLTKPISVVFNYNGLYNSNYISGVNNLGGNGKEHSIIFGTEVYNVSYMFNNMNINNVKILFQDMNNSSINLAHFMFNNAKCGSTTRRVFGENGLFSFPNLTNAYGMFYCSYIPFNIGNMYLYDHMENWGNMFYSGNFNVIPGSTLWVGDQIINIKAVVPFANQFQQINAGQITNYFASINSTFAQSLSDLNITYRENGFLGANSYVNDHFGYFNQYYYPSINGYYGGVKFVNLLFNNGYSYTNKNIVSMIAVTNLFKNATGNQWCQINLPAIYEDVSYMGGALFAYMKSKYRIQLSPRVVNCDFMLNGIECNTAYGITIGMVDTMFSHRVSARYMYANIKNAVVNERALGSIGQAQNGFSRIPGFFYQNGMFYNCHIASVYNGLNFGFYSTHASNYFCNANFIYSGVTEITIFPPYGSNNPDPDNYSYSLECNNAWSNIDDMFTNFKVSGTVNISFRKDVPLGSGELARSNVTNINCSCLNLYINGTNIDFTGFQFITNTYRRIYIRDTFNLSQLKSAGYITGSYAYNNINSSAY